MQRSLSSWALGSLAGLRHLELLLSETVKLRGNELQSLKDTRRHVGKAFSKIVEDIFI